MAKTFEKVKSGVTLMLRNYGAVTAVAQFGRNFYDAMKFLKALQFETFNTYGGLPEKFGYYVEYKEQGVLKTFQWSVEDLQKHGKELMEHLNANEHLFKSNYCQPLQS